MPVYLLSKYVPPSSHGSLQPKRHASHRTEQNWIELNRHRCMHANTTPQNQGRRPRLRLRNRHLRSPRPYPPRSAGETPRACRGDRVWGCVVDRDEPGTEMVGWGVYGGVNYEIFGFGWVYLACLGESFWLFVHDVYCIPVVLALKHECYLRRF